MLQKIREKSSGWIAGFVIVLLCIPFAFFGVNSYFQAGIVDYIALVNGEEIPDTEYRRQFSSYRQRMAAQLGDNFDPRYFDQPVIKRQVIDDMVRAKVLTQASEASGMIIPDGKLADQIMAIEAFQIDGEFNPDVYQQLLAAQFMSPGEFEDLMRRDLINAQFPEAISQTALVTDAEIARMAQLEGQQRRFDYVLVDTASVADDVAIEEQQILDYYEENADRYSEPEQVTIQYIEIDAKEIAKDIEFDEDTLKLRYEDEKGRFIVPERRAASHILLELPADADDGTKQAIMDRAADLAAQARDGADFAELAKAHSEDPGSADFGGDLGWVERGMMVEAFEDALYAMEGDGAVSDPVESAFGVHVIKLTGIEQEHGKSYEEVREEILADLREADAERLFVERVSRATDLVYEDATSLAPVAEALDVEIKFAGPFDRSGGDEGIAADAAVIEAAFSDLVLLEGSISDAVNITPNHAVFLRVSEHQEASRKPLEEVREEIVAALEAETRKALAEARAQTIVDRVAAGEQLEAVASAEGYTVTNTELVGRRGASVPYTLVTRVFELGPALVDTPTVVESSNDDSAVVVLREIVDGNVDLLTEAETEALRTRIAQTKAAEEGEAFMEALRQAADVQIIEDNI